MKKKKTKTQKNIQQQQKNTTQNVCTEVKIAQKAIMVLRFF